MSVPHPNAPGLPLGIDKALIERLVRRFYTRVRADDLLGPIFNTRIADWEEYLEKLTCFWASVTLLTGDYKGTPLQAHLAMPDLDETHFGRWLALFRETLESCCTADQAALFNDRAHRISCSFQLALGQQRGELPLRCPVGG